MSITTINAVFYNYIKSNVFVTNVFYINADSKTKQPYLTVQMVEDPDDNTFLCSEEQGKTRFLISIFQKSYTKGINNRKLLRDYIKAMRGNIYNGFNINNITITNMWDNDKNIDGAYAFSIEVLIEWEK